MGRYVLGITGASGALYAQRVCRAILAAGHECHVCCTPYGQRLLHDELGIERLDSESLAAFASFPQAPGPLLPPHPPRPLRGRSR